MIHNALIKGVCNYADSTVLAWLGLNSVYTMYMFIYDIVRSAIRVPLSAGLFLLRSTQCTDDEVYTYCSAESLSEMLGLLDVVPLRLL